MAVDSAGRMRWKTTIPDYIPWAARAVAGGGILFAGPPGKKNYHTTGSLVRAATETALIQFGEIVPGKHSGNDFDFGAVNSRMVRLSDGVVVGGQNDLPVVLTAAGHWLLTAGGGPDLWAAVRRYSMRVQ